jgi:hypothetical protein
MRSERLELPIRIVVENPVPGLAIALQRGKAGKAELVPPASRSAAIVAFDLVATIDGSLPDGRPRLLARFVQGPPEARFVYLPIGKYAGQADSEWAGRVKVPLGDLGWEKIETLQPGGRLVGRIPGKSPKGGPALAGVHSTKPLRGSGACGEIARPR